MQCWHCQTELIWGGDHDCHEHEDYAIETNLSCPNCNSFYLVYLPESPAQPDVENSENTKKGASPA